MNFQALSSQDNPKIVSERQHFIRKQFTELSLHLNSKIIIPDFDPCGGRSPLINMFIYLTRRPHTIISTRLKLT
ncbi:hypothetical protein QTP88_007531 [Uroleucon formosanum]